MLLDLIVVGARHCVLWIFIEENEIVRSRSSKPGFRGNPHRNLHLSSCFQQPEKPKQLFVPFLALFIRTMACEKQKATVPPLTGEMREIIFFRFRGTLECIDECFTHVVASRANEVPEIRRDGNVIALTTFERRRRRIVNLMRPVDDLVDEVRRLEVFAVAAIDAAEHVSMFFEQFRRPLLTVTPGVRSILRSV